MPRFYLPQLPNQGELALPESIVRHIHVLRLQAGDEIVLFDGRGMRVAATLQQVEKRKAACTIGSVLESDSESPLRIHLIQAVSSGERMDFTLQKSVELGVASITPVLSERCVVRLQGERADKRVQRWQEIAVSACEQCGRDTVPPVQPILLLSDYLRQAAAEDGLKLLMSLQNAQSLREKQPAQRPVYLLIGPEGGWTAAEEQAAVEAGFEAITLGKRVLRTETASLAAIAAMQTLWGDFC